MAGVSFRMSPFTSHWSYFVVGVLQHAKKVVSDSPGLVDFTIGLVNSVFNWPDGEVMFFEEFK